MIFTLGIFFILFGGVGFLAYVAESLHERKEARRYKVVATKRGMRG